MMSQAQRYAETTSQNTLPQGSEARMIDLDDLENRLRELLEMEKELLASRKVIEAVRTMVMPAVDDALYQYDQVIGGGG